MTNYRKILVPTDFSNESLAALQHAVLMAGVTEAEITLLHVMETYDYNAVLDNLGMDYKDVIRKGIESKLQEILDQHPDWDHLTITPRLEAGKVHRVIHRISSEEDMDLVVMGTHGASGIGDVEKMVLGSNAYRVVNGTPVPVLTIRDAKKPARLERIILPLDISKKTTQKVRTAIDLAKRFNASIYIVAIIEFFDDFNPNVDRIPKELEMVEHQVRAAGVECTAAQIKYQDVAKGVIQYGEQVRGDLIVIMTRQENLLEEWILGSHARKIVSQSPIPVLSVRPAKAN